MGALVLVVVITEVHRVVGDNSRALPSMPGSSGESPRGSKMPTGKVLAVFRATFIILQGEVLFLIGLCSLRNANCPAPNMTHRVYVAVKMSPQELCSSEGCSSQCRLHRSATDSAPAGWLRLIQY